MKRNIMKYLITFILLFFLFLEVHAANCVPADYCSKEHIDSILDYFGFNVDYNFNTKIVTLRAKHGTFFINKVIDENNAIVSEVKKLPMSYPYDEEDNSKKIHYTKYQINGREVLRPGLGENGAIRFKVDDSKGGTIKISLAYFREVENGKKEMDCSTGCYSYDHWKYLKEKNPNALSADNLGKIGTFNIMDSKDKNGNDEYIEISIPKNVTGAASKVKNENYDSYCRMLREGYNYENSFNSRVAQLYSNSIDAQNYYRKIVPECWEQSVVYSYDKSKIIKLITYALKNWSYSSIRTDTGFGDDEAWSINFNDVKAKAIASNNAFYAESVDESDKDAQLFTLKSASTDKYSLTKDERKGSPIDNDDKFNLTCDYEWSNANKMDQYVKDKNGKSVYNINANIKNYYAINIDKKFVSYKYHHNGPDREITYSKSKTVCVNTCEEAVEVKYGPPVASKAGMCFEYQVQVTSRILCDSEINPDGRPDIGTYCSPVPYCNDIPGYTTQAGPVQEYDKCIKDCDGGKYTSSCSNKCYDKVYKNKKTFSKTGLSIEDENTQKLSLANNCSFKINGRYDRTDGKIRWNSKSGYSYARYYLENQYYRTYWDDEYLGNGSYTCDEYGFKRKDYGTSLCTEKCKYIGCGRYTYLNASDQYADYVENMRKYNIKVVQCKLGASCSTKTAVFTINADYSMNNGEKSTNYSPSSLISNSGGTACSNPKIPTSGNMLLNYQGCYKTCNSAKQYHARWSFPGTWINIKTGELSYAVKPSDSWYEKTGKFCTPTSSKNVNGDWLNYYFSKNKSMLEKNNIDTSDTSQCDSTTYGSIKNPKPISEITPTMNIHASTDRFGYFGWKFNIDCFYSQLFCGTYKVRTIDRADMFPDTKGIALTNPSKPSRDPGFNWSSHASSNKNEFYIINPSAVISKSQNEARERRDAIYTDDNLDYEIILTKSKIRELRDIKNYTQFSGKVISAEEACNGIPRYYSKIITDLVGSSGVKTTNGRRPNENTAQCNNIKQYASNCSAACDDYSS